MKIGYDAKRIFHNTTGLGNYSRDLVTILSSFYKENTYFLFNPKPKKVNRFVLKTNTIEKLPTTKFWRKFSSIWRQGPIVKQLVEDNIDIYHGLTGEIPKGIEKTNIKSVVTIHDLIFVRYPKLYSFFDRKIHFKKFLHAAKKANKIIAISEQTKRDIVTFFKIDASKIEVVYQGCHQVFKEEQSIDLKESILKKYNIPTNFILNVGTVETRKNALTIVKSIKNLDIPLVIVGKKTEYYKKVEAYINNNKLTDRVYFLEKLSLQELAALYQMATIFVYPSIFEGFGIPIIEALYSKTPVITTKGGVFPEAGGMHSIYINPMDEKELALNITALLSDKNKRDVIAEKGFEFVQKFNDDVIADNLMRLYKSL